MCSDVTLASQITPLLPSPTGGEMVVVVVTDPSPQPFLSQSNGSVSLYPRDMIALSIQDKSNYERERERERWN